MRLFNWIPKLGLLLIASLMGNWVGDRLRLQITGEPGHQMSLLHTNPEGEITLAINPLLSNLLPGMLMGFLGGKPHWLWAFIGGAIASIYLGDQYEQEFVDQIASLRSQFQ